jgi:TolA-binding protein
MNKMRVALVSILLIAGLFSVAAQAADGIRASTAAENLRTGIRLLADGQYSAALAAFDSLMLDSGAGELRAEGAYWAVMTHLAAGNPSLAEKTIETFLISFPGHPKTADLLYQQGRSAFLQNDYERSLRYFQAYISGYPRGEYLPAAVFWSGESLFFLGRLSEAEKLYKAIGERYPDSVKAEAAHYRLSLIQFKYREDELLTLLKWSHEESLRTIEEFQRREKAYEQALAVYQRRFGEVRRDIAETQLSLEDQLIAMKTATDELQRRIQDKDARIAELEKRLELVDKEKAAQAEALAKLPSVPAAPPRGTQGLNLELLALKERALGLLEFYVEKLADEAPGGRSR